MSARSTPTRCGRSWLPMSMTRRPTTCSPRCCEHPWFARPCSRRGAVRRASTSGGSGQRRREVGRAGWRRSGCGAGGSAPGRDAIPRGYRASVGCRARYVSVEGSGGVRGGRRAVVRRPGAACGRAADPPRVGSPGCARRWFRQRQIIAPARGPARVIAGRSAPQQRELGATRDAAWPASNAGVGSRGTPRCRPRSRPSSGTARAGGFRRARGIAGGPRSGPVRRGVDGVHGHRRTGVLPRRYRRRGRSTSGCTVALWEGANDVAGLADQPILARRWPMRPC